MYTVYTCLILGTFLTFLIRAAAKKTGYQLEKPVMFPGALLAAAFLSAVLGILIACTLRDYLPREEKQVSISVLASVRTIDTTYVLSTNTAGGVQYLHMRLTNLDGSTTHVALRDDSNVSVKEDPNLQGHGLWIHYATYQLNQGPLAKWAFTASPDHPRELIVVPVGSVVHDFKVQ